MEVKFLPSITQYTMATHIDIEENPENIYRSELESKFV